MRGSGLQEGEGLLPWSGTVQYQHTRTLYNGNTGAPSPDPLARPRSPWPGPGAPGPAPEPLARPRSPWTDPGTPGLAGTPSPGPWSSLCRVTAIVTAGVGWGLHPPPGFVFGWGLGVWPDGLYR
ncbi:unnamed protein product [Arctogadus glacialis]